MKKLLIVISGFLLLFLLIPAACAMNLTLIDIGNGTYTKYWFSINSSGNTTLDAPKFIYSLTLPFLSIMGYWWYAAIFFLYIGGTYLRGGTVELPIVMMLLVGSIWGIFMPPEAVYVSYILLGLAIGAMIVRVVIE